MDGVVKGLDKAMQTMDLEKVLTSNTVTAFILLPEKFLQFDWLRADVFQLNLKYLHVKITVTNYW